MSKVVLRPSGIGGFFDCSYRWYRDTISDKPIRKVGLAAHWGTGVHKSSELYYKECINSKKWIKPSDDYVSAGIDEFREKIKNDEPMDLKEFDLNQVEKDIKSNSRAYLRQAQELNYDRIPQDVEKSYFLPLNSNSIEGISGTLDIVGKDFIADIKTMRKFKSPKDYVLQQSTYALLRQKQGEDVQDLVIHRVNVEKNLCDCKSIIAEYSNPCVTVNNLVEKSKEMIRTIVKTCDEFNKTGNEWLFRGNPYSLLCSPRYCAYYEECKYRKEN